MNTILYDHAGGRASLPPNLVLATQDALSSIEIRVGRNEVRRLRKAILESLRDKGWSARTRIDVNRRITVTSMNQGVALALQTGNMARFYADLLKLQTLYLSDKATGGIFILLTADYAKKVASNIAYYERLVDELKIFRKTITMPILVVGIGG